MSDITVKPWADFTQLTEMPTSAEVLIRDRSDLSIGRISSSLLSGGTDSGDPWDSSTTYATDEVVVYTSKFWISLSDDNTNNPPSDGSTYWEEVSAASSTVLSNYSTGLYTIEPTVVIKDNTLYKLTASKPYTSSSFYTELELGDWELIGKPSLGLQFKFDDSTEDSDPTTGCWRISESNDYLYVSKSVTHSGADVSNLLDLITDGSAILIEDINYPQKYFSCNVTGAITTDTNYVKIPIVEVDSDISFLDTNICNFTVVSVGGESSHATDDGYGYMSKDGDWEYTDQLLHVTLGSLVSTWAVNMDELRPMRVDLDDTLTGLTLTVTAPSVTNTNYILRNKDVIINNDTGSAVEVTISADTFENGLSSVYSFPTGVTRLYFTYARGLVYAGLVEIESSGGDQLTTDELAAVNGANTPSSTNVFATMDDIETFTASFSFSGISSFDQVFGRAVIISSVTTATDITELRVGLNGVTATDITAQLPLTIAATDVVSFEATYDYEADSYFTLIGTK